MSLPGPIGGATNAAVMGVGSSSSESVHPVAVVSATAAVSRRAKRVMSSSGLMLTVNRLPVGDGR